MSQSADGTAEDEARAAAGTGWQLPVAVAAAVLLASLVPLPGGAPTDPGPVGLTEPFHLLGYGALAAALVGPLRAAIRDRIGFRSDTPAPRRPSTRTLAAVSAILVATAFGFGVEVVQGQLPWRSFAVADALVNATGALIGAAVAVLLDRRRARIPA